MTRYTCGKKAAGPLFLVDMTEWNETSLEKRAKITFQVRKKVNPSLTIFQTFRQIWRYFTFQKQPPDVFSKRSVLRNCAKVKGRHLYQSLFFNKVPGLRHRCFL